MTRLRTVLFVAVLASCGLADERPPTSAPDRVRLVFLHVNDSHGRIDGTDKAGGYARLATMVRRARAEATQPEQPGGPAARVFLLHCGDIVSRGDDLTSRSRGSANIAILNRLGVDAFVPGNGEYYLPVAELNRLAGEAKFPFLAANVKTKNGGKPIGRPSIVLPAGPVNVAFVGLCYARKEVPFTEVEQDDWTATARRLLPQLRGQADFVVALTHIGFADDVKLVREVGGIDLLLGGHSHTVLPNGRVVRDPDGRDVTICQAGSYLAALGRATVRLTRNDDGRGWKVESVSAELLPLDESVPRDAGMTAFIDGLKRAYPPVATQPAAAE